MHEWHMGGTWAAGVRNVSGAGAQNNNTSAMFHNVGRNTQNTSNKLLSAAPASG